MHLGPHAAFIVAAYAAAAAIVAGLVLWVLLDRLQLTRALDTLEAQGFSRRSGRASEEQP